MEGGFFLDVVITQSAAILKLLASKDESLLVWGDAFLVLDLGLHVLDRITCFNFQGDGLSGKGLYEDLHTSTKTEHQMEGGLFLDVVVTQCAAILKLLSSEDKTLLVWRDALLVLDLGLHILNGVRSLNLQGDGLASQSLDKNLHTSTETEHQVEGGFFLDVVVAQGPAIFKLLSSKDKTLLVWRDALLVLDLSLDILNSVGSLNFKSNGLPSQSLHENLHTSTETEHQVEGGFFLDVVVTQGSSIFELLASEDESLLVWGDALFVLNLCLHVLDSVRSFDFKGDGFSGQSLHKDLHTSTETENKVKS